MNLRVVLSIFGLAICFIVFPSYFDRTNAMISLDNLTQYSRAFKDSVSDVGPYIRELEAQQFSDDISYDSKKRLAVDLDIIYSFYDGLTTKLGIFGDDVATMSLIRHIPLMVFVEYDGFRVITPKIDGGEFSIDVGIPYSFSHSLSNGDVISFNIDDSAVYYEKFNNRYLTMDNDALLLYLNNSGLYTTNMKGLLDLKYVTINKSLTREMELALKAYNDSLGSYGFEAKFSLPADMADFRLSDIGFMALIQGYPLPSGDELSEIAFGSSRVTNANEYNGVIRSDGRHIAYEVSCGVPSNTMLIEVLYGEKEAASKGYFVESCPY